MLGHLRFSTAHTTSIHCLTASTASTSVWNFLAETQGARGCQVSILKGKLRVPVDTVDVPQLQLHFRRIQIPAMSDEHIHRHERDNQPATHSQTVSHHTALKDTVASVIIVAK